MLAPEFLLVEFFQLFFLGRKCFSNRTKFGPKIFSGKFVWLKTNWPNKIVAENVFGRANFLLEKKQSAEDFRPKKKKMAKQTVTQETKFGQNNITNNTSVFQRSAL